MNENSNASVVQNRDEATILVTAAAAVALLYAVCFSGVDVLPQLSFTLFCPTVFAIITFSLKRLGWYKNPRAIVWVVPILAIAIPNGIFDVNPFTYGNVLVMHILMAAYTAAALRGRQDPAIILSPTGFVRVIRIILGHWIVFVSLIKTLALNRQPGRVPKTLLKILLGVFIAMPVLMLIILLLISADGMFGKIAGDLIDAMFAFKSQQVSFVITTAVVWIYAVGYAYQGRCLSERNETVTWPVLNIDVVIGATFLLLVNAVFLLFTIIQAAFLFNGGFMKLPEGMVYAQYAREGFFQLLFVTVINFSVIIVFMSVLQGVKNSNLLRVLLFALCGFTGVLIASSFYRMSLYIDVYGHTTLRLCVITFLVMETFLLVVTVLALWADRIPMIRWYILIGFIFYVAVNFTGSDYLAARLNINLFLSGQLAAVDLYPMGSDGLRVVKPLTDNGEYICIDNKLKRIVDHPEDITLSPEDTNNTIPFRWSAGCYGYWQNWSWLDNR